MSKRYRPIVGVSKCLEFDNCRYDGKLLNNSFVNKLKEFVDFIPVCPEMGIGLGSPRKPIRLVRIGKEKNLYQPSTDTNLTQKMRDFTEEFTSSISKIDGFILKRGSPTCGVNNVRMYHNTQKDVAYDKSSGLFAEMVIKKFPLIIREDEGRLNNLTIRENFLTRLFAMCKLRKIIENNSLNELEEFHKNNHVLFIQHSLKLTMELDLILKNKTKVNFDELSSTYKRITYNILCRVPSKDGVKQSIDEIYYFTKEKISDSEAQHFTQIVKEYDNGIIQPSHIFTLLYSWVLRFGIVELQDQTIFNPFPKDLIKDLLSKPKEYAIA